MLHSLDQKFYQEVLYHISALMTNQKLVLTPAMEITWDYKLAMLW